MFSKNHQTLIKDCYPPPPSSSSPSAELAQPVSNATSKLCFYAAGRPKKIPKVALVLVQRAQSEANSGAKGQSGLGVTILILKELVSECRAEVGCFAQEALEVVGLGLQSQSLEVKARAASLFHGIVSFASGPTLSLTDETGRRYIKALESLASLAQDTKDTRLNFIGLSGLDGVANSEWMYTSHYSSQLNKLVPALLFNCYNTTAQDRTQHLTLPDAKAQSSAPTPPPLASRKSRNILPPKDAPTAVQLAQLAVTSFRTLTAMSHGTQLVTKLAAIGGWLDTYDSGKAWENSKFVEWVGTSSVSASAVHYRAGVVGWWADQVAQGGAGEAASSPKTATLLRTLSAILRSSTNLVGLGVGNILSRLSSVLVRRETSTPNDPLSSILISTIAALASQTYYVDQINDMVSDLVEVLRSVTRSVGSASSLTTDQRSRVGRSLMAAIVAVLREAKEPFSQPDPQSGAGSTQRPPLLEGEVTVRGNGVHLNGGEQGIRSKKESSSSVHRPRRNPVSPEVMQESLAVLTDADPALRLAYAQALVEYVSHEMPIGAPAPIDGPIINPDHELANFLQELHASIYDLATSLALATSPASLVVGGALTGDSTPANTSSPPGTQLSSRRNSHAVPGATVSPEDLAALAELAGTVQARGSVQGVLTGLPMLLALYADAPRWEAELELEQVEQKIKGAREVAVAGVLAAAQRWNVVEVEDAAEQARLALSSSPRGAAWPAGLIVDAFAASMLLQAASGKDQLGLSSVLRTPFTAAGSGARNTLRNPYLQVGGNTGARSVSQISSALRLAGADPNRSRSAFRAPSLADLQNSLGRSASARTSAAPSMVSTSGSVNTYATSRRTAKGTAASVLARLEKMGGGGGGALGGSGGARPPYLVAGER